jgi:hypothetical protein
MTNHLGLVLSCLLAIIACEKSSLESPAESSPAQDPTVGAESIGEESTGTPRITGACRRWLSEVILRAGAPEQQRIQRRQLLPSFGALKLLVPRYEGRFEVYVFAEEPDRINVDPGGMTRLDRAGAFTIRRAWAKGAQQFSAIGREVWVTAHVNRESERVDLGVMTRWFGRIVHTIQDLPPPDPCSSDVTGPR